MINAEIEARELQNKLSHICPDAKIDFKILSLIHISEPTRP